MGGFFHILDIAELLRVVQAAEMIAQGSTELTLMAAFDGYLIERAKHSLQHETPDFEILARKTDA